MLWFGRRFARLRMRLAGTLERAAERHSAPEPPGREAWLQQASSVEDLWSSVQAPQWAVHLAWLEGRPLRLIMDAGTRAFAAAVDGFVDELPTVTDYGFIEPQERPLSRFFDWTQQPLEDLAEGVRRYEKAAKHYMSRLRSIADTEVDASPYRDFSSLPADAATKLHLLIAGFQWFVAANAASQASPRKPPTCEALGVSLAHAFAARPSKREALLEPLVRAFRG